MAATAAAIGVIFVTGGDGSSVGLASNSFSLVCVETGSASAPLELGESPFGVAVAGKVAWLAALLGRRRPVRGHSHRPAAVVPVGDGPDAVAVGEGSVWVANSGDGTVSEVSPAAGTDGR